MSSVGDGNGAHADHERECKQQEEGAAMEETKSSSFFLRNEMDECCLEEVVRGEYVQILKYCML